MYKQVALKPQDILITLKILLSGKSATTFSQLAADLHMSASEVHGGVRRAELSRLLSRQNGHFIVSHTALREFVFHGLRFSFPPVFGTVVQGMPTGAAASPLDSVFQQGSVAAHVWPYAQGAVRGIALCPLYPSVPKAAANDPALYELLALIDGHRAGAAREREAAEAILRERYI